jgi:hypothetical protein
MKIHVAQNVSKTKTQNLHLSDYQQENSRDINNKWMRSQKKKKGTGWVK